MVSASILGPWVAFLKGREDIRELQIEELFDMSRWVVTTCSKSAMGMQVSLGVARIPRQKFSHISADLTMTEGFQVIEATLQIGRRPEGSMSSYESTYILPCEDLSLYDDTPVNGRAQAQSVQRKDKVEGYADAGSW